MIDGFDAWRLCISLRLHFHADSKFDFFKSKPRALKRERLETLNDGKFYHVLASRTKTESTLIEWYVAMAVAKGEPPHVIDLLDGEADRLANKMRGRLGQLERNYQLDKAMIALKSGMYTEKEINSSVVPLYFMRQDELYPQVACLAMRDEITPETFVRLAEEHNAWDIMDQQVRDVTGYWRRWSSAQRAYLPFMPRMVLHT